MKWPVRVQAKVTGKNRDDVETVDTEERCVPPDVEEMFDEGQERWEDDLEWERELRELQRPTEQERENADRLVELVAAGLANELDDSAELIAAYEELKELESERRERIIEHHEQRDRSTSTGREE